MFKAKLVIPDKEVTVHSNRDKKRLRGRINIL